MHGVGFEPTRFATPHLECGPLDRSGIRASPTFYVTHTIYKTILFYKIYTFSNKISNLFTKSFVSLHFIKYANRRFLYLSDLMTLTKFISDL